MADTNEPRALYDSGELSSKSMRRSSIINRMGSQSYAASRAAYMSGKGAYDQLAGEQAPEIVKSHKEAAAFLLGGPVGSTLIRELSNKTNSVLSNTLSRFKSNYNPSFGGGGGGFDDSYLDNVGDPNKGVGGFDDEIEEIDETFNNDDGTVTKRKTRIKTDKKKQRIVYRDKTSGTPRNSGSRRVSGGGVSGRVASAGTAAMMQYAGQVNNSTAASSGNQPRSSTSPNPNSIGNSTDELTRKDLQFITYLSKSIVAKQERSEERSMMAKFTTNFSKNLGETFLNVLPTIRMFNAAKYHSQLPNAKKVGVFAAMNTTLGMIYSSNRAIAAETQRLLYDIATISRIGLGVDYTVRKPQDITTVTEYVGKSIKGILKSPFSLASMMYKIYKPEKMDGPNGHLGRLNRSMGLRTQRRMPLSTRLKKMGRTGLQYGIGGLLGAGVVNNMMGGGLAAGLNGMAMGGIPYAGPAAGALLGGISSIPYLPYVAGGMAGYAAFRGARGIARSLYNSDGMMGRAFKGSIIGKAYGGLHKMKAKITGQPDDTYTIESFIKQYMQNTIRDAKFQKDTRFQWELQRKYWKKVMRLHNKSFEIQEEEHKEASWHRKTEIFKWAIGGLGAIIKGVTKVLGGIFNIFKGVLGGIFAGFGLKGLGATMMGGGLMAGLGGVMGGALATTAKVAGAAAFKNAPAVLALFEMGKFGYNLWQGEDMGSSATTMGLKGGGALGGGLIGGALGSLVGPLGTVVGSAVGGIAGYVVGGMVDKAMNPEITSFGADIGDTIVQKGYEFVLGIESTFTKMFNVVESVVNSVSNFITSSIKKVTDFLPEEYVEKSHGIFSWLSEKMSSNEDGTGKWKDILFWGPGRGIVNALANATTPDQTQEELDNKLAQKTATMKMNHANENSALNKAKASLEEQNRIVQEDLRNSTSYRYGEDGFGLYGTDNKGQSIEEKNATQGLNQEALKRYQERLMGKSSNITSTLKTTPQDLEEHITAMSTKYGIPVNVIKAVIQTESNWDPNAGSHKGAQGLMQLMPGTAREMEVTDSFDPYQNIEGGTKYLRKMLDMFDGNLDLALAAYNAGPGKVRKYGGIPPFEETQNYVLKINRLLGSNSIKAELKNAQSKITNSIDGFMYGGGSDSMINNVVEKIDGFVFGGGMGEMYKNTKDMFKSWGYNVENATWSGVNSLEKAYQGAKPSIDGAMNRTKTYVSNMYDKYIKEGFTNKEEIFSDIKARMINDPRITEYISKNYPGMTAEEVINSSIDKVKLEALQVGNTLSKNMSDANNALNSGIHNMSEDLKAMSNNFMSNNVSVTNATNAVTKAIGGMMGDDAKSWVKMRLPNEVVDLLAGNLDN